MRRLKIASLLVLASCASPIARPPGLRAVPRELGAVTWAVSPADVIGDRQIGTPVVWVGQVAEFTHTRRGDKLVLEWICDYLPFVAPGEGAIRQRPLSVGGRSNRERFLVNLVEVDMTEEKAESMKGQYAATPHYILVAGTVDSIVDRAGVPTVFLYTWEFELSRDLVSRVQ